jgi:hypothetical protein
MMVAAICSAWWASCSAWWASCVAWWASCVACLVCQSPARVSYEADALKQALKRESPLDGTSDNAGLSCASRSDA